MYMYCTPQTHYFTLHGFSLIATPRVNEKKGRTYIK